MRKFRLYANLCLIAFRRCGKYCLRKFGEFLKRTGRILVVWGGDTLPRWSLELFHRCYLADAEFHIGMDLYRGPMYAVGIRGNSLVFTLNWVASRRVTEKNWVYGGAWSFRTKFYETPWSYNGGDICFFFDGGYAILFLGKPREKLAFNGDKEIMRTYLLLGVHKCVNAGCAVRQ
ncbi:MAG: hypothetical protein AAB355_01600 [Patescibacteria group bacterium]